MMTVARPYSAAPSNHPPLPRRRCPYQILRLSPLLRVSTYSCLGGVRSICLCVCIDESAVPALRPNEIDESMSGQ